MSKFSNILRLIILLKSRGKMKAKELAEELEVNERMIRKYIDDLEKAGVYIASSKGINGGYSIEGYDYLVDFKLTEDENAALSLAQTQLKYDNFIYYKEFNEVVDKVMAIDKKHKECKHNLHYVSKGFTSIEALDDRKKCLDINAAIISRNKIKMKYFSLSSGVSERIVQPYAIINYKGAFYFVGFCETRGRIIDFKISRIKDYSIINSKYEIPKDFSLKDYMKNSIGIYRGDPIRLKLRIEKPMSYIVSEKKWSDNQEIIWSEDESIIFNAEMAGKTEIISWILSMGNKVTVLEPESLRVSVVEEISKMNEKYLNK